MKVLVFGTFDHLHPGHLHLLASAQKMGDLHVVIARDETVQRIKKKFPQQNQEDRQQAIQTAFPDARVFLGDVQNYLKPVQDIDPDIIVLGYDQQLPPNVTESDLPCPTIRMDALEPEKFKSSLLQNGGA